MQKQFHEAANLFPLMNGEEFQSLIADIEANGLRESIWLYEGKIIDGRNRYRACEALKITPTYREWEGNGSAVAFAVSENLHRRHLNESQKAAISLDAKAQLALEAEKRMKSGANQHRSPTQTFEEADKGESAAQAAELFGTNRQYVYDAEKIKKEDPALLEAVKQGELSIPEAKALAKQPKPKRKKVRERVRRGKARTIKQAIRDITREEQIAAIESMPTPRGRFNVIVVDPPWKYNLRPDDVTHRGACPYPGMATEEISAIELPALDDCVLWLWTTNAFIVEAHQIAKAWGFEVKTILTWAKDRMGVGDWLRGQTEHCLFAVKGKPVVRLTNQTTLLIAPTREHSRKPDEFYTMVDALCVGTKCELFSREERDGWKNFGSEIGKF